MKAIERKDVEAANNYLRAMIISAACTYGMGKFSPWCVFLLEESKGGSWSQKGSLVWWCMQEKEMGFFTFFEER